MISDSQRQNFETLLEAVKSDDVCIMEVDDTKTGEKVDAVCAVVFDLKTEEYVFTPFAFMVRENPYERFIPPSD